MNKRFLLKCLVAAFVWLSVEKGVAQENVGSQPKTILFIGNSFTFAHHSSAMYYHPESVTDLNDTKIGGVPALFKALTNEAGLNFTVSLETSPGKNLEFHLKEKATVIAKAWDYVVMHGFSTLDKANPGDPTELISSAKELALLLRNKNPNVDIHLVATWSRADQTYLQSGHWYGQPIENMALDIRKGYDLAAKNAGIKDVIPVGEAWTRAIKTGVADPNPYDGTTAGQVNLWGDDNYHGSSYGYYLEALMDFGSVTGLDPLSLGKKERVAIDLGFTADQAVALQKVAHDELSARAGFPPLKAFEE
jgi:hypothetical protein